MAILCIRVKSTECNGWPSVKVMLDHKILYDLTLNRQEIFEIYLDDVSGNHLLQIEMYGKTENNILLIDDKIVTEQSIEIAEILVDGVKLSDWFTIKHSTINFNDEQMKGLLLCPNGTWDLKFETPIITFILDEKIKHEAIYNQDYLYPWSYKLGPDSVKNLSRDLNKAKELINSKL